RSADGGNPHRHRLPLASERPGVTTAVACGRGRGPSLDPRAVALLVSPSPPPAHAPALPQVRRWGGSADHAPEEATPLERLQEVLAVPASALAPVLALFPLADVPLGDLAAALPPGLRVRFAPVLVAQPTLRLLSGLQNAN